MINPTVKFSHSYDKLRAVGDDWTAVLLQVLPVKLESLSREFIDYDTDNDLFTLPSKGNYLLLIFEGMNGTFTTLRRNYPPHKRKYYDKNVGNVFEVLIVPDSQ